jgi:hypothetical protein
MTTPGVNRQIAVSNAASLLASFCGRTPDGVMQACQHDHSGDGEALVRMVEQYAFPELLRDLQRRSSEQTTMNELAQQKIEELEARAREVPAR